jgi:antitoxin (DNA-binding transcriptional repressor) of toxin-antitoxin stability system
MGEIASINATQFKATCLELLDRLAAGDITRLEVTKRGRVVAVLVPPERRNPVDALFGAMKGCVTRPDTLDLTEPVFEGEVEAEQGRLLPDGP